MTTPFSLALDRWFATAAVGEHLLPNRVCLDRAAGRVTAMPVLPVRPSPSFPCPAMDGSGGLPAGSEVRVELPPGSPQTLVGTCTVVAR